MNNATHTLTLNDYRLGVRPRAEAVALTSTPASGSRTLPVLLAILVAVAGFGAWTYTHGVYFLG